MKIRTRLSLYFTMISSCLLLIVLACVYYLFDVTSREEFYRRLDERINFAAGVYLEADEISPATLKKLRRKFIVTLPQEEIRFYDSSGNRAFINGAGYEWSPAIINRVRTEKYVAYQTGNTQVVGRRYADNQGVYVILASAADVTGRNRKMILIRIMGTLFLLQLFIQFIAGRWFAARVLRPVQQVNTEVQTITATDLHRRLDEGAGNDELGTLAHNFNGLLERLEGAFDTQKMFIANASHELKTPLTGIMGMIEVTLSKQRTEAAYQRALQDILSETERLQLIVGHLLLLANEENGGPARAATPFRIDDLLWELQEQHDRSGITPLHLQMDQLPADERLLYVYGNKTMLLVAFTNIIRNAFKYSGGKAVYVALEADDSTIRISISDAGIGMDENTMKHIFEPFYRGQPGASYEGSGIGLYIAQRIVALYHGRIEVSSKLHSGSTFTILLPSRPTF